MTTTSWVLLAASTFAFALTDWWATWVERVPVRYVAKPATLVGPHRRGGHPRPRSTRRSGPGWWPAWCCRWPATCSSCSTRSGSWPGWCRSCSATSPTSSASSWPPRRWGWTLVGLAVVVACVAMVGRRVVPGVAAGDQPEMVGPVIAYLVVISAMVVSAFGTAAPWAIVGAGLFYASDATLAWNRFLEQRRFGPLAVMVTYHLGQIGLVAWLV